jgi:P pilus assembly chaperone PapD
MAARRSTALLATVIAATVLALSGGIVAAQSLTVLPINIEMAPKQMATTLTVINQGEAETSVQIRVMAWK